MVIITTTTTSANATAVAAPASGVVTNECSTEKLVVATFNVVVIAPNEELDRRANPDRREQRPYFQ